MIKLLIKLYALLVMTTSTLMLLIAIWYSAIDGSFIIRMDFNSAGEGIPELILLTTGTVAMFYLLKEIFK